MSFIITRERLKLLHPQWEPKIADIPVAPQYDRVLCWRIEEEEKSAGGLYIPNMTTTLRGRAVILAFGLKAADVFYTNGTELGDVVTFAEFAGNDKVTLTANAANGQKTSFLWLLSGDILGNESLIERLKGGGVESIRRGDKHYLKDISTPVKSAAQDTTAALDPL